MTQTDRKSEREEWDQWTEKAQEARKSDREAEGKKLC